MTALMKAVRHNDVDGVKTLIANGADVNALDPNGDAPLVMAAYLGHAEVGALLLNAGADVRAVTRACGRPPSTPRPMRGGPRPPAC